MEHSRDPDDDLWSEYAKKKEFFLAKLYENFSDAIKACRDMTLKLRKRAPLNQIAWYTRNLLELQIWVEFCCRSKENAAEFYEDAICDLVDLNQKPGERDTEMMAMLEKAKTLISTPKQPHKFARVQDAATSLGHKSDIQTWRDYYDDQNKILSKFVHPTALSVVQPIEQRQARSIQASFVAGAEEFARETLQTLENSFVAALHKHYVPINVCGQ